MNWRQTSSIALAVAGTAALYLALTADGRSDHLVFATWGTPAEIASFQELIDQYNARWKPAHTVVLSHIDQISYSEHLLIQAAARGEQLIRYPRHARCEVALDEAEVAQFHDRFRRR